MSKSRVFEDSKKDKMMDRKAARKRKMSLRDFEITPEDAAMDAAGQAQMNAGAPGYSGGGSLKSRGAGAALKGFDYKIV